VTDRVVLVLCTAPNPDADGLADALLQEQLVACVNLIGPVRSRYRWQGAIESGEEMLLLMKTRASLTGRLRARIAELHPYQVPEVLEVGIDGGLSTYLEWVLAECRPGGDGTRDP
jgi:periplasmic divalent cation tolerance protein